MSSRGLWHVMSARQRRSLALSWSALFVLSLLMQYFNFALAAPISAAVGPGLFELDGNAVHEAAVAGDDWDQVFAGTSAADDTRPLTDGFGAGDDIFTGGNTKDIDNISSWLWKVGSVQDKDDIENAFAAAYTSGGSTYAYFGLDRYQTSGDATAGFWFFKNGIAKAGNGSGNGTGFTGVHAEGDILVVLDFSNGGVNASAKVYTWHNGALTDTGVSGGKCDGSVQTVCAIANTAPVTAPWTYDDKGTGAGPDANFPANALFEGGLNLTGLGLDTGCFSSFLAETRSSTVTTATLSDFALGQFSFCVTPSIATQVKHDGTSTGSNGHISIGESVTDTATLTGNKGTVEGTVEFFSCFSASSTPDCSTGGTSRGTKTLSGGTATSNAFTPTAVGEYCFRVEYTPATGSKYLASSHTNSTTECFVVDKRQPLISTSATEQVDAGQSISDSATLAGATSDAGGSITFKAYGPNDADCSGAAAFTSSAVPVSGNATYGPVSFTPSAAGTYRWIASYTGDAKNLSATGKCNDAGENDTVLKVNPTIATQASASVVVGGQISDTATVSGGTNPTGTVTFNLYGPDDATCANAAIFTSANRPLSGGTATSAAFTTTQAGTYRWRATYNGDANNNAVTGACNAANENVVVTKKSPSIATSLVGGGESGASITVTLGTSVHDTSTLTGATADAGGTVHYQVFDNPQCTGTAIDAGTKTVTNGVPGNSDAITFNLAGKFYWQADYSGDANNNAATSSCNLEVVTVAKNIPSISTTASATVQVGGSVSDTAHLSGGFNPTGTILFALYGPNDATCALSAVYTKVVTVDHGNGDYSSGSFSPSSAGTYRWIASYSGDAENAPVSGACNDANENVVVTTPNLHAVKLVKTNAGAFGPTSAANPGDKLTFQITVTNSGDADATNVPVSDDIAPLLTHATYNNDCNLSCNKVGSVLNWTIATIAKGGGSVVLTFSVTLDASFPSGTTHLPNVVVVTGPGSNCPAQSTDPDCDTDTIVQAGPLVHAVKTVAVNDGPFAHDGQALPGSTLNYKIVVSNTGNAPAANVLVEDDIAALLAHADYNADCSNACTLVGSTLKWTIASIAAGGSVTLTFSVTLDDTFPTGTTHLPNVVVVTGPGSNCPAQTQDPDCGTENTVSSSALSIDKSFTGNSAGTDPDLNVPAAKIGDTLHYTLAYHGEGKLTGAVITDVLPKGLEYVVGSAHGDSHFTFDSYNAGTRTLTWKASTLLDPEADETNSVDGVVTYDVKVLSSAPGFAQPLTNVATIDSDQTEPDSDTASVAVLAPPLELTPPPTNTLAPETGTSNPGFALMLILLGVAGLALGIGFITPVPERVRRRDRR
jgi:uncharacterized repeat protein (TIGR01451 family)